MYVFCTLRMKQHRIIRCFEFPKCYSTQNIKEKLGHHNKGFSPFITPGSLKAVGFTIANF